MAQEVKLIEREENYTNPFTLESQLKQVEGLWGRHGVFITSVANKIVNAIAWYNALWLLQWYALIFFSSQQKQRHGEKKEIKTKKKKKERKKGPQITRVELWSKKKFQGGGLGHFGLHVFHIKYIFVNSNVLCIVSFPDQNEILVSI